MLRFFDKILFSMFLQGNKKECAQGNFCPPRAGISKGEFVVNNMSLKQKLWLPLVFAWIALFALSLWNIYETRNLQIADRQHALIDITEMSYSIVAGLHKQSTEGKISADDARKQAIARVADQRYTGNGYITLVGADSVVAMHPMSPKLNGKNMIDFKDAKGNELYKMIAATGSSAAGEGFLEYWWPRPNETKPSPKMGFVKRFKPWNWGFWDLCGSDKTEHPLRSRAPNLGPSSRCSGCTTAPSSRPTRSSNCSGVRIRHAPPPKPCKPTSPLCGAPWATALF